VGRSVVRRVPPSFFRSLSFHSQVFPLILDDILGGLNYFLCPNPTHNPFLQPNRGVSRPVGLFGPRGGLSPFASVERTAVSRPRPFSLCPLLP